MTQQITILIVDDEPVSLEVLKLVLSGQGYQLITASNGLEALQQAATHMPDLILLDIMMPGMSGFDVCQQLRNDDVLAEVPILLITGLDDRESRLRGIEVGADDFISKPVDQIELRKRVQTITRLDRYRQLLRERDQRMQAEAEILRRNHELALMKEAERLKDQFVSNVSHELRTPLSIIMLLSGNLDTLYDRLDDDRRRTMIRNIRKHTQSLHELISDVLELSRIDSRRVSTEHEILDFQTLVVEEVNEQQVLAHNRGQHIHLASDSLLYVLGHANQLRQAIRNLIHNAIKYTPESGIIWCESRCHRIPSSGPLSTNAPLPSPLHDRGWPGVDDLAAGQWVGFRVIDNGVGIAQSDQPHIFERFYRVKTETTIPGTGLGLSIAQDMIHLHGGQMGMESVLHDGSTFAFYLPMVEPEKANGSSVLPAP